MTRGVDLGVQHDEHTLVAWRGLCWKIVAVWHLDGTDPCLPGLTWLMMGAWIGHDKVLAPVCVDGVDWESYRRAATVTLH